MGKIVVLLSCRFQVMSAFLLLVVAGCSKEEVGGDFVARVGTSRLSADDLIMKGGIRADSSLAARNYINEWVSTELLYQEAVRRRLDQSDIVRERIQAVGKRLAIDALLDEALFQDSSGISNEEVDRYFADHQTEFTLAEDLALVSLAMFDDRGPANTFRSAIVRGASWDQAAEDAQTDTVVSAHLLQLSNRKYHTASTLFPGELWKLARTVADSSVSFVVTTDAGYHVLFLHKFFRKGELPDLAYIAHEIHGRLLMEGRKRKYEELLRDLRSRFPVEVHLPSPSEQTTEE